VEEKAERETEAGLLAGRERVVKFGIRDSMEPIRESFRGHINAGKVVLVSWATGKLGRNDDLHVSASNQLCEINHIMTKW
jgi:hypothetical protein